MLLTPTGQLEPRQEGLIEYDCVIKREGRNWRGRDATADTDAARGVVLRWAEDNHEDGDVIEFAPGDFEVDNSGTVNFGNVVLYGAGMSATRLYQPGDFDQEMLYLGGISQVQDLTFESFYLTGSTSEACLTQGTGTYRFDRVQFRSQGGSAGLWLNNAGGGCTVRVSDCVFVTQNENGFGSSGVKNTTGSSITIHNSIFSCDGLCYYDSGIGSVVSIGSDYTSNGADNRDCFLMEENTANPTPVNYIAGGRISILGGTGGCLYNLAHVELINVALFCVENAFGIRDSLDTTLKGGSISGAGTHVNVSDGGSVTNRGCHLDLSKVVIGGAGAYVDLSVPQMTSTQRDALSNAPAGLLIYNTTTNKLNFRAASAWEVVTSS